MADERESRYLSMSQQFPDSPLGYFSLGRYYLEQARFVDAAAQLGKCVALDPTYAAALLSLGDAYAGDEAWAEARSAYARAREAALAQHHPTLAKEIDERVEELQG
jgi:tetratricopeptide (TPR) repeat protein